MLVDRAGAGLVDTYHSLCSTLTACSSSRYFQYHLGTLKAKLARLRNDLFVEQAGGSGGGGTSEGFSVARNGDVSSWYLVLYASRTTLLYVS
jgi:hypothetical protein